MAWFCWVLSGLGVAWLPVSDGAVVGWFEELGWLGLVFCPQRAASMSKLAVANAITLTVLRDMGFLLRSGEKSRRLMHETCQPAWRCFNSLLARDARELLCTFNKTLSLASYVIRACLRRERILLVGADLTRSRSIKDGGSGDVQGSRGKGRIPGRRMNP